MRVCAAPAYLAARGRPRRPEDLSDHNCLGYTLASSDGWRFEAGTVAVEGSLRASNGDALVAAAAAGLGVIYQPTFLVADALRRGALVALDLGPIPSLPIHAVMPSRRRPPAKVRALVRSWRPASPTRPGPGPARAARNRRAAARRNSGPGTRAASRRGAVA